MALCGSDWQSDGMTENDPPQSDAPTPNGFAPGCIIAFACLLGAGIGAKYLHSPSLGIVIGAGAGAVIGLVFWLIERRR